MKRHSFATAAAAMLAGLGGFGMSRRGVHRFTGDSRTGRSMISAKTPSRGRSKYMPHQGEKERERAARCYMQSFHGLANDYSPNLRSAPVMHVISKSDFYGQPF